MYREVYDLENSASGSAANAIGNIHYNEKNYSEAIKWYKKGIEKTLDWAYYNLANCYYYGNGVRKDELKALDLYKKAYDLGDSASGPAINILGVIAYNRRNYKYAVAFYKRGTEKNYNWAYYNLAECYYNGNGVKKDKNKAYELYRKAAELGIEEARSIINNWY